MDKFALIKSCGLAELLKPYSSANSFFASIVYEEMAPILKAFSLIKI